MFMSQDIVQFIMINILALQDNHLERPHCHSLLQCSVSGFSVTAESFTVRQFQRRNSFIITATSNLNKNKN